MAQQTAVEWLVQCVNSEEYQKAFGQTYISVVIIEQAKQMEKKQIEDAHIEGQQVFDNHPHTQWNNDQAKQYYEELYVN